MLNLYLTFSNLYWRSPRGPPPPPPEGLERTFVETCGGEIEILSAKPKYPISTTPVVFAHGGMGCAWVWTLWMRYLADRGITSYAISYRGHGNSWYPSFLRMLYTVTKRDLADDLLAGIRAVQKREGSEIILVGHSIGGGLSQYLVNEGEVKVKGLALLGSIPGNGSWRVYKNWVKVDSWFLIRMLLHGWHSISPLSHPFLLRQAFFSNDCPEAELLEFQRNMSRYESFVWAIGMLLPFVNPEKLLSNITGWGTTDRVLIMAGVGDKLLTRNVQESSAKTYRTAFSQLVKDRQLEAKDYDVHPLPGEGDMDSTGHGVRVAWVPGSGHHLQNDVTWEVGAAKLLDFIQQL